MPETDSINNQTGGVPVELSRHLLICIVGQEGNLRSPSLHSLLEELHSVGNAITYVYVDGYTIRPSPLDRIRTMLLYGRQLTEGEIGCALSHRAAYGRLMMSARSWMLILEDDAVVPIEFLRELSSVLRTVCKSDRKPTVISLYSEMLGERLDPSMTLHDLNFAPSHTVAYLINRPAAEIAWSAPRAPVSSADWPPWSTQVTFRFRYVSGLGHSTESSIQRREREKFLSPRVRMAVAAVGLTKLVSWRYFPSVRDYMHWFKRQWCFRQSRIQCANDAESRFSNE